MTYPDQPALVTEAVAWDTAALVLADLANYPAPTVEDVYRAARQYPITDAECRRVVELITEAMEGRAS